MHLADDQGQVYAVGPDGAFLRWVEGRWESRPVPTARELTSAVILGAQDIWVSDSAGSIWHHDGSRWSETPAQGPVLRLLGQLGGQVLALEVGEAGAHGSVAGGAVLRREASGWARFILPYDYCLGGDFTIVDGEVWSAGLTCDGRGTSQEVVRDVEVRRHDGAAWTLVGAPIPRQGWYPRFERARGQLIVRASGTFAWDGRAWTAFEWPARPPPELDEESLWDGEAYLTITRGLCDQAHRVDASLTLCAGSGMIYASNGAAGWVPTQSDPFGDTQPTATWGALPAEAWAGADTTVAWGSGPTRVFRARLSTGARLEYLDGGRWVQREDVLRAVHGSGPDDAWLVTDGGLLHWDGTDFLPVALPADLTTLPVRRVHALGPARVLVLTEDALLSNDGGRWALVHRPPPRAELWDVAGTGPNDLWVTQVRYSRPLDTSLAHFDGSTWTVRNLEGNLGEVSTTLGGETWLMTGALERLGRADAPIPVPNPAAWTLWVDARAVWLTTHDQALRLPR